MIRDNLPCYQCGRDRPEHDRDCEKQRAAQRQRRTGAKARYRVRRDWQRAYPNSRREPFDPRDDSAASQEVELLSTQRLHCAMRSMSILASVIQLAATCACRSRG